MQRIICITAHETHSQELCKWCTFTLSACIIIYNSIFSVVAYKMHIKFTMTVAWSAYLGLPPEI